ncbi:MAG: adenosylcobinamide amidohydrolase [Sulfolobales archaeon]
MRDKVEILGRDTIVIRLRKPMRVFSTLPLPSIDKLSYGETVEHVIFREIDERSVCCDLREYYIRVLRDLGVERALILLTSASLEKSFKTSRVEEAKTDLYMSIGLKPSTCLNSKTYEPLRIGTINIVAVVDLPLTDNASIDLLKTIAEAKTLASSDIILRCSSRSPGTVTDSISILKPADDPGGILFAGMSTTIGNAIAREVYRLILEHAMRRSYDEILRDLIGLDLEDLKEIFKKIYSLNPVEGLDISKACDKAVRSLIRVLRDPNVWAFIIAARELDLHGISGAIPGLSEEDFKRDSKKIVADEILGIALAQYLAGTNGMFTMYWIERLKESGVLEHGELEMFEDDIVSALLAYMLLEVLREVEERS